jgi:hypothetical protein
MLNFVKYMYEICMLICFVYLSLVRILMYEVALVFVTIFFVLLSMEPWATAKKALS